MQMRYNICISDILATLLVLKMQGCNLGLGLSLRFEEVKASRIFCYSVSKCMIIVLPNLHIAVECFYPFYGNMLLSYLLIIGSLIYKYVVVFSKWLFMTN